MFRYALIGTGSSLSSSSKLVVLRSEFLAVVKNIKPHYLQISYRFIFKTYRIFRMHRLSEKILTANYSSGGSSKPLTYAGLLIVPWPSSVFTLLPEL